MNVIHLEDHDLKNETLIQVTGHADTTGSDEYNKRMGLRRAQTTHSLFSGDHTEWLYNFQRGIWGDEERDMILLAGELMEHHPAEFKKRFVNMKMKDEYKLKDILLEELRYATSSKTINYPIYKIYSKEIRNKLIKGITQKKMDLLWRDKKMISWINISKTTMLLNLWMTR